MRSWIAAASAGAVVAAAVLVGPLTVAPVAPGAGAVAAPAAVAAGGRYVALGDSYAAGLGLSPASPGVPAPCGQSTRNYPHRVADALGLSLTDVTCSSAVTGNFAGPQTNGGATLPPQFDALTADTALVTLTIGGNDLGFGTITSYCASLAGPDGPVLGDNQQSSCEQHFVTGGTDALQTRLQDVVVPSVRAALSAIAQRSPHAKVVVVEYPALVPDQAHTPSGGCWQNPLDGGNGLPFTTADLPYLAGIEARLNQALTDVATATGAGVASIYAGSLAHTACGTDPWVNGVQVSGLSLAAPSLHPSDAGVAQLATATTSVARTMLAGGTPRTPAAVAPTSDGSFGGGLPGWFWPVLAVVVLLLVVVAVGVVRVQRRRR